MENETKVNYYHNCQTCNRHPNCWMYPKYRMLCPCQLCLVKSVCECEYDECATFTKYSIGKISTFIGTPTGW